MNQTKREKIEAFARKVREVLQLATPLRLNDLEKALVWLGGEVVERPFSKHEASIKRVGDGFQIALDPLKPPTRQLFSLAHEFGHLLFHMGFGNPKRWNSESDYLESYARSGYDEEELEANEFAAALLMPKDEFNQLACTSDLNAIASHFGVSTSAALIRGRRLGVYGWS